MFETLSKLPTSVLVVSMLCSFAALGLAVAVVVATIVRWQEVRSYFWPGVRLALLALALAVPGMVAQVWYFEMPAVGGANSPLDPIFGGVVMRIILAVTTITVAVLGAAYSAVQVGVGELAAFGRRAYPLVVGKDRALSGWWIAGAFGLATGIVSVLAFRWLNVREGAVVELVEKLMPKLQQASAATKIAYFLPPVLGAAVTEEILFRGVIQGWLAKWLGPGRAGVAGAIVLTAGFWAVAHVANADAVWLKCLQIFLIGLGFGAIARRFSVEASIIGHVVINLTAVVAGYLMGGWTSG
jgi:membrane protease YdiL (CAAX protease family)